MQKALYSLNPRTYQLFDRLRRKVRPWLESDAQKHQRERREAEYLLLSLTNCGRTWLRVIVGRAMQLHCLSEKSLYASVQQNINLHDLYRFSEINPTFPAIKPMHEKYGQFGNSYEQQKVILLVRDPRDALVSRYHQHRAELPFNNVESYIIEGSDLAAYIQFYNDWQTYRDRAKDFLLVRYEDLKANTFEEMCRVFIFLDLPVTSDEVHQAIDYASFKNMRKMELEGSQLIRTGVMSSRDVTRPESFKVRKGKIGSYRKELSTEIIEMLDTTIRAQLNPIYGYR
ncbi:MAG: sulfotransferase domain-containing protein [Cyanobacteria bacterium P01_C01_bin.121]